MKLFDFAISISLLTTFLESNQKNYTNTSLFEAESELKNSNFGEKRARTRWNKFSQDMSP